MSQLKIVEDHFEIDDKFFRIISGAMHYFRCVPEYWKDRLLKMKACGLNTVETYIPWNVHEPEPDNFCFEGICDIERFVHIAEEVGLYVLLRPSPYICAEWESGGHPAWLLADPEMKLRCMYEPYIEALDIYYDELIPRLVPLQSTKGGPVIAMQIENEYGSYGSDKAYLKYNEDALKKRGIDVLLFTSDGAGDMALRAGTLPHIYKTANFGSNAEGNFAKLQEYQTEGPLMCMEFWNGWFDTWGGEHHTRDAEDAALALDGIFALGGSVNFYMFHGGTNFGFMNGAKNRGEYAPFTTSYDYDAALDEAGNPTDKFYAFRDVIANYADLPELELPEPNIPKAYGKIVFKETAPLLINLDNLSEPVKSPTPFTMERLGQNYGFILYRTELTHIPEGKHPVTIQYPRDRAQLFLNGEYVGLVERNMDDPSLEIDFPDTSVTMDILVENQGHGNYGPFTIDRKGITEGVRVGFQFQHDWEIYPLPLHELSLLKYSHISEGNNLQFPSFFRTEFTIDKEPADTFLKLPGWQKGVCWINGFNIGRYWDIGPQQTLYVPGPLLKNGINQIVILELHGCGKPEIILQDIHELE